MSLPVRSSRIDAEAFERTNALSVEYVLGRLPQFVPDVGSNSNDPGNGGQGNVQLRGLGTTSTLVLLDGRRLIPANGNGAVDVNIIPGSLVERVEVITGGASAVYGSDAIAGVVNFKLKDEFDGVEFDGGWGQTDRGDGAEYFGGLTAGTSFAAGRGEAYGYVGYSERESVFARDREFSAVGLGYFGPGSGGVGPDGGFLPYGSSNIAEGAIFEAPSQEAVNALFATYGEEPGAASASDGFGINADGSLFSLGNEQPGTVVNFRGDQDPRFFTDRIYTYNFAPWHYLQVPLERVSGFARASFEVGPAAEIYGQALYADYTADIAVAPTPLFPLYVPVTNPYIPADLRVLLEARQDPAADVVMGKRFVEVGPRIASHQHDTFQLTLGSRGRAFGDWDYDAYLQTGAYDSIDSQTGHARRSKVMELTFAPDGGLAACGGLDLFGPDSISTGCAQYIAVGVTNREGYDQTIAEASMTGTAVSLPSGDLKIALGIMYKRDEYFYRADPIGSVTLDDGFQDVAFGATADVEGSDHNTDLYVEAVLPLLNGVTGVERLEAVLGYRHSEYASAGGVDAYKAELLYDPVRVLTLRSSFEHAVRAPNVVELYQPLVPTFYDEADPAFGGILDPCGAGSVERGGPNGAQVEALCLAQGVPAERLAEFTDSDGFHFGLSGGNPDLDPETADTVTAGVILRSWSGHPLISSMQLSLDWYRIEMADVLGPASAYNYIPLCFDARVNPEFDANYKLCRYFSRDAVTGEIVDLMDIYQNDGSFEVSGIDAQFDWGFDLGPGEACVNWLVSWMDQFETTEVQGLPPFDDVGFVNAFIAGSFPEWKSNLNLSYTQGALTLAGQWRYIDGMRHRFVPEYELPSYDYFDLFASYEFDPGIFDGLTLRVGIENLTDDDPPLLPWGASNTDPSQYDVLGRRYSLGLSYRF